MAKNKKSSHKKHARLDKSIISIIVSFILFFCLFVTVLFVSQKGTLIQDRGRAEGTTPTPTIKPGYCDASCSTDNDCALWLQCVSISGYGKCRKRECINDKTCNCKTTAQYCDASCNYNEDCGAGYRCYAINGVNRCRNEQCVLEHTCQCLATPTQTPSPTVIKIFSPTPLPTAVPTETPTPPLPTNSPTPMVYKENSVRATSLEGNTTVLGNKFTIYGTALPYASVVIVIKPDTLTGAVEAGSDGSWTYIIPKDLTDGVKIITVTAKDVLGKESIAEYTVTVGASKKSMIPMIVGGIGFAVFGVVVSKKKKKK